MILTEAMMVRAHPLLHAVTGSISASEAGGSSHCKQWLLVRDRAPGGPLPDHVFLRGPLHAERGHSSRTPPQDTSKPHYCSLAAQRVPCVCVAGPLCMAHSPSAPFPVCIQGPGLFFSPAYFAVIASSTEFAIASGVAILKQAEQHSVARAGGKSRRCGQARISLLCKPLHHCPPCLYRMDDGKSTRCYYCTCKLMM